MIVRNGMRSTLRARGRSALFTALILALTLLLSLGLGMWAYSGAMLAECDENYRSIALVEYMGTDYPDANAADGYARAAAAALDDGALAAVPGVELWERDERCLASAGGYQRWQGLIPYEDYGVIECFQFLPVYDTREYQLGEDELPEEYFAVNSHDYSCEYRLEGLSGENVPAYILDGGRYYQYQMNEEGVWQAVMVLDSLLPDTYVWWPARSGEIHLHTPEREIDVLASGLPVLNRTTIAETGEDGGLTETTVYVCQEEYISGYQAFTNQLLYVRGRTQSMMLTVEVGDSGFAPEPGARYMLHGRFVQGNSSNKVFAITDFYEGCPVSPWERSDLGEVSPLFQKYADYYRTINEYINLTASDDVAALEVFQQGILQLQEGRFPQAGEGGVCLVSGNMANSMGLALGDELTLQILSSHSGDRFSVDFGEERTLTVVGITTLGDDYDGCVWVSGAEGGFGQEQFGYQLGRAVLDNAQGRRAADQLQATMPENVRVTLYDQGYAAAAEPLNAMRSTAVAVTIAAACGALAALFLFAYLFVGRQRETVTVLVSLGTPTGKINAWLLSGAALLSGLAALVGSAAGRLLLGTVTEKALALAREMYSADLRYSEAAAGLVLELEPAAETPLWPAAAAGLAVFAAALILSLVFLRQARRESAPRRGRVRVRTPRGGTSVLGRGPVRFALLSARRGGWRSYVVVAVALVMTVFMGILTTNARSWDDQLDSLYAETELGGQVLSPNGRWYDNLVIPISAVRQLWDSGMLSDISVSLSWHYWQGEDMPAFGSGTYARETRENWILEQPRLIAVNSLSAAPDFYYDSQPDIRWLEGWDESVLSSQEYYPFTHSLSRYSGRLRLEGKEWLTYPVLASERFLSEHDMVLGGTYCTNFKFNQNEITVAIQIVGAYTQRGPEDNLYVPLSFWCGSSWITGEAPALPDGKRPTADYTTAEEREAYNFNNTSFQTCRFTLSSAGELESFRSYLAEQGFSQAGKPGSNRTTVMLRDQSFTETVGGLNRYIAFGRLLFPVLLVLVCVLGFIVSWLMVNGRRMEFAVMRGMGASRLRVFFSFFLEQALLGLAGCLAGALALTVFSPGAAVWLMAAAFLVCYLLGCALSVLAVGRTKLMALLSERE